jgi:hypothetical protein
LNDPRLVGSVFSQDVRNCETSDVEQFAGISIK